MKGETYPILTEHGARILERLVIAPAGATMIFDEGLAISRGGAQTTLARFAVAGLCDLNDIIPAARRDHGDRFRAGPPQQLYEITKLGRAALAAHKAALAAYQAEMELVPA